MELLCLDCGAVFYEGSEKLYTEPHGESYYGCPNCGGAYEEAHCCDRCGKVISTEDMIPVFVKVKNGNAFKSVEKHICNECYEDAINYDNVMGFLKKYKDCFKAFLFEYVYECSSVPESISEEMHEDLWNLFVKKVEVETISGLPRIMTCFKEFVQDNEEFLEFLAEGGDNDEQN